MTNDDLKRFYPQNAVPEMRNDFARYDENGNLPGSGGGGVTAIQLIYNGTNILNDGVIQTYIDIENLIKDKSKIISLYNGTDGSLLRPSFGDGAAIEFSGTAILGGMDYTERIIINNEDEIKLNFIEIQPKIKNIVIEAPETSTEGTLTEKQIKLLKEQNLNEIYFNNEIFKLSDDRSQSGYLIYSHVGEDDTHNFFIKCITITLSTRGWVLTTKNAGSKQLFRHNIRYNYSGYEGCSAIIINDRDTVFGGNDLSKWLYDNNFSENRPYPLNATLSVSSSTPNRVNLVNNIYANSETSLRMTTIKLDFTIENESIKVTRNASGGSVISSSLVDIITPV